MTSLPDRVPAGLMPGRHALLNAGHSGVTDLTARRAGAGSADEARDAARQFEALLVHNMLKAMRSTGFSDDRSQSQSMYYDMLDEKLADIVSERGGLGLAEQLGRQLDARTADSTAVPGLDQTELQRLRALALPAAAPDRPSPAGESDDGTTATLDRLRLSRTLWNGISQPAERSLREVQRQFVDELLPMARQTAARLGTTPASVLAVAAHESDWGRQVIGDSSGDSSHNLFGIKAFDRERPGMWHQTTEYVNGQAETRQERFRRYADRSHSISDFASFLQQNPRYATALQHAADPERFIRELHSAGYATDPRYASKVLGVMRQIESLAPATQGGTNS